MEIGVLITVNKNTDIIREFQKAVDLDIKTCQISMWGNVYTEEVAEKIMQALEKTNMKITGLWAGWSGPAEWNFYGGPATLGLVPKAYRGIRLKELLLASDFAEKIGVSDIITHVGFLPENPLDPDFTEVVLVLRYLAGYMKAKNQFFLFETGQETPTTLLRTIDEIGLDNLGINLDTGNLIRYGKASPADAIDVFGKYVRNTHCKDGNFPTDGKSLGKEMPLGEGRADFALIIKKLKALGYEGPLTIEREITGPKQIEDIIKARDLLLNILKKS